MFARDISGVPTAELAAVYARYTDCDIATFAKRSGIDERDLRKSVLTPAYAFTGLRIADTIVNSLGQNLGHLVKSGELHIIPAARGKDSGEAAARMMAETEGVYDSETNDFLDPTEEQMQARALELVELRRTLCVPSEEQQERLRRDSERSQARQAQKSMAASIIPSLMIFGGKLVARHQTIFGQFLLRHNDHVAMVHAVAMVRH